MEGRGAARRYPFGAGATIAERPFLPASWAYFSSDDKASGKALEAVKRLPPEGQDQIAMAMLTLSGNEGAPEETDAAHPPSVLEGLAQAKRRPFARDADVEVALRRFDR